MEEQKARLHFTRVRAKGDPSFYEPQADIRQLLPAVTDLVTITLAERYKDDVEAQAAMDYLQSCFKIFQIRLDEDSTPCVSQVAEFLTAIRKVESKYLHVWLESLFTLFMSVYALFVRRDTKLDQGRAVSIVDKAWIAEILSRLSEEERKQFLQKVGDLPDTGESFSENGIIVQEGGKLIEHVQRLVACLINHSGAHTWAALAEACDAQFSTASGKSDQEMAVIALAYPDYAHPTLRVVTDEP